MVCKSNLREFVPTDAADSELLAAAAAARAVSKDVALCGSDDGLTIAPTVTPSEKMTAAMTSAPPCRWWAKAAKDGCGMFHSQ
jgi:hypothetical protein